MYKILRFSFSIHCTVLAFQRLLTCLEQIRHKLDSCENDYQFFCNYFRSEDFRKLLKVRKKKLSMEVGTCVTHTAVIMLSWWYQIRYNFLLLSRQHRKGLDPMGKVFSQKMANNEPYLVTVFFESKSLRSCKLSFSFHWNLIRNLYCILGWQV